MLLQIWTRNDATGLLDNEFKDGDVLITHLDSFEASLGLQDKKSYLCIKIPDPPGLANVRDELVRSQYEPGATPNDDNVVRRKRIFSLNWRASFTASEIDIIEDANQMLPDGDLSSGGTVTSGVVSGKFTITDFVRK